MDMVIAGALVPYNVFVFWVVGKGAHFATPQRLEVYVGYIVTERVDYVFNNSALYRCADIES